MPSRYVPADLICSSKMASFFFLAAISVRTCVEALCKMWTDFSFRLHHFHLTCKAERERHRKTNGKGIFLLFADLLPKCSPQPGLSQAKTESQKLNVVSHMANREPSPSAVVCCLPGCGYHEAAAEAKNLGLEPDTPVWNVVIPSVGLTTVPNACTTCQVLS